MRVIHTPFTYYPDPAGGTEVYVASLARHLSDRGIESVVAVAAERDETYTHDGIRVQRFAAPAVSDLHDLYGEGDPAAAANFARLLDIERPDVVHLHALTSAYSLRLAREVRRRGVPLLFTYHLPTVTCQRGTLMRWGADVCDGQLVLDRCAPCRLHSLGMPRPLSEAVGRIPVGVGERLARNGHAGGPWTAMRMRSLVATHHAMVRTFFTEVDHTVVLCDWTRDLLLRNHLSTDKITLCRHGLPAAIAAGEPAQLSDARGVPLRIAYLGRLAPEKGADVLIRALRTMPGADIALDLYGISQGAIGDAYLDGLRHLAAGDGRIRFLPPVPQDRVVSLLRAYHLLAAPSRWLETGPLVVLEAFAAGTPVIGSNHGGIAEMVSNGVNGLLVDGGSVDAWRRSLQSLVDNRDQIERLRAGITPPRSMAAVAAEMAALYKLLVGGAEELSCVTRRGDPE